MDLSLCMIVKNEAEKLPRCLSSVKDVVDEMIIVDTGSTDQTPEIAVPLVLPSVTLPGIKTFPPLAMNLCDMPRAIGFSFWMPMRC
jgi:hypothetical protein